MERPEQRAPVRTPGAVLATTSLATLVVLMNYSAPMLTIPGMTASFGTGLSGQAWLLNGIALGLAALLLVAGSFADDYGRKRVFVTGMATLVVTIALGAAATSTLTFTLARVAQGAASAAIIASSLGLLAHAYPAGPDRVRATGIWGAALSGGTALGPVVSAALGTLDWRLSYVLYAAAALALTAVAVRTLTESRNPRRGRPDLFGALLLGLALTALLAALTLGRDGWLRPAVWAPAGAAVVLVAGFAAVERRAQAPLLDLTLFRRPLFLAATSGALFTGLGVIGLFSYLPALFQQSLGMSAFDTSWLLFFWSGIGLFTALQAKRLARRVSPRHQLALGFVLSAIGALTMLGALTAGSWTRAIPGFFVAGIGSGLLNAALPRLAVESVPADRAAMGSGANNTARYIGSSIGLALTVVIATSAHSGDTPKGAAAALAHGTDTALYAGAGLMLAGALAALVFRGRRAVTADDRPGARAVGESSPTPGA
ncbi:MFS transporter [Streptomyces iconiensis]|uniref:MFS transporter n=1 Tax=Streptomyces iconiensis TaxID=1384038 RepID=A0ABT6ZWP4_9ACTN|nr:MFS transporter [Streptomyces iconiensis]MDJ1133224.1 MFS transporter [Streptomyces iconiensis]